ncbi:DUF4166 domain-containing protein [Ensifer canadensis]
MTQRLVDHQSLYRQVLGPRWDRLPAAIRALHEMSEGTATFRGCAVVERGRWPLARLAAFLAGFPTAAQGVPVEIRFACTDGREVWTRRFGDKVLRSSQQKAEDRKERLLAENFGPFRILCSLAPEENRLHLKVRGWSVLGLPLPLFLAPGGRTYEEDRDGLFHFNVEVESPLTGLIVRYRGWLKPADEPTAPIARETLRKSDNVGALVHD